MVTAKRKTRSRARSRSTKARVEGAAATRTPTAQRTLTLKDNSAAELAEALKARDTDLLGHKWPEPPADEGSAEPQGDTIYQWPPDSPAEAFEEQDEPTAPPEAVNAPSEPPDANNNTFGPISDVEEAMALFEDLHENDAAEFQRIVETYRAEHPESWDAIALCPTQHGIDEMIRVMKT